MPGHLLSGGSGHETYGRPRCPSLTLQQPHVPMPGPRRSRISKHRLEIADQEALTRFLAALEAEHGSQTAAARSIGIEQNHFSKLKKGQFKAISFQTFRKILRNLGAEPHEFGPTHAEILGFSVAPEPDETPRTHEDLTPEGQALVDELEDKHQALTRALHAYRDVKRRAAFHREPDRREPLAEAEREALARAQQRHSRMSRLRTTFMQAIQTPDEDFAWGHYLGWIMRELQRLEAATLPFLEALWSDEEYRPAFQQFLEGVGRDPRELPGDEDPRCRLALLRALAPLADGEATWGAERTVAEMRRAGELGDYLQVALQREELLLRPRRDSERVRRTEPPMSYGDWLGMLALEDGGQPADPDDWVDLLEEVVSEDGEE